METTDDRLPTGVIECVEGTKWSLQKPKKLAELSLDDIYFGVAPDIQVWFRHDTIVLKVHQKAKADYTHVVVYTPNSNFFCIENQTSSTDAHNLYARGFEKKSHLQILEARGKRARLLRNSSLTYFPLPPMGK